jgi:hypothetical protein
MNADERRFEGFCGPRSTAEWLMLMGFGWQGVAALRGILRQSPRPEAWSGQRGSGRLV